jgi:hypothetical protein
MLITRSEFVPVPEKLRDMGRFSALRRDAWSVSHSGRYTPNIRKTDSGWLPHIGALDTQIEFYEMPSCLSHVR